MSNVETIFNYTTEEGVEGTLGIDQTGKLYWNGKPVVTEQKVKLQAWVNLSIIVAAISSFIIAVVTALQFFGFGFNS